MYIYIYILGEHGVVRKGGLYSYWYIHTYIHTQNSLVKSWATRSRLLSALSADNFTLKPPPFQRRGGMSMVNTSTVKTSVCFRCVLCVVFHEDVEEQVLSVWMLALQRSRPELRWAHAWMSCRMLGLLLRAAAIFRSSRMFLEVQIQLFWSRNVDGLCGVCAGSMYAYTH